MKKVNIAVGVFLLVVFGITAGLFYLTWSPSEKAKAEKTTTSSTPATVSNNDGQEKQKFPKTYAFLPDGCVTVPVDLDFVLFYPRGGEITITPPPDAKPKAIPWDYKPGDVNNNPNKALPKGDYLVCKKDKDAWGVDVYN